MRSKILWVIAGVIILISLGWAVMPVFLARERQAQLVEGVPIPLPDPVMESSTSPEEALAVRRSIRDYQPVGLSLAEIGQLLWATQGGTPFNCIEKIQDQRLSLIRSISRKPLSRLDYQ